MHSLPEPNSTSRRNFMIGAGAALAGTSLLPAQAEILSRNLGNGMTMFTVGLPSFTLRTAEQKCANWCWAACIEGIFRTSGRSVSQTRIVSRLFGRPDICLPATGPQIINTINGSWQTDSGAPFQASAMPLVDLQMRVVQPNAIARVANELSRGRPLINGALGHATVLTAMSYIMDRFGNYQITELIVRDPMPGPSFGRRRLTPMETAQTIFIAQLMVG